MGLKENLNFLYIIDSFPPGGMQSGIRSLEISKRLIKSNIYPIILTKKICKSEPCNDSLIKEIPSLLKIFRTFFFEINNKFFRNLLNFLCRIDYYIPQWIPFAYLKARSIIKKNDNIKFIYTSGPLFSTHIIGYLLKKMYNIPLIVEYRDPWCFNPYSETVKRWFDKKIDLAIEKRILKSADIIITVSPALELFLKFNFPFIRDKFVFNISSGLNLSKFPNGLKNEDQEITITFAGTLYRKRTIIPFLKIISNLKKENFFEELKFTLKIYGAYKKNNLKNIINKLDIADLVILGGYIPREDILFEIHKSNLALHVGENFDYPTIAFKVWDYLSCRKKILYLGLKNSYTAKFLNENELGFIIPINNLQEGKKVLKNILIEIKNNNINCFIDEKRISEFSWDNITDQFKKIILKRLS